MTRAIINRDLLDRTEKYSLDVITVSRKPPVKLGDESNLICHPPLEVTKGNPTSTGGEDVIRTLSKLSKNQINNILIGQCIRSVTSVGANYREACEAESSRDFVHKIRLCKKEARESNYWLVLLSKTNKAKHKSINALAGESVQLVKIFSSIVSKFNK